MLQTFDARMRAQEKAGGFNSARRDLWKVSSTHAGSDLEKLFTARDVLVSRGTNGRREYRAHKVALDRMAIAIDVLGDFATAGRAPAPVTADFCLRQLERAQIDRDSAANAYGSRLLFVTREQIGMVSYGHLRDFVNGPKWFEKALSNANYQKVLNDLAPFRGPLAGMSVNGNGPQEPVLSVPADSTPEIVLAWAEARETFEAQMQSHGMNVGPVASRGHLGPA